MQSYVYGADVNQLVKLLGEFSCHEGQDEDFKSKLKSKLGIEIEDENENSLLQKMKIYFDYLIYKEVPTTPVLGSYITKCLEPNLVQNNVIQIFFFLSIK